ncbi:MAG: hypothetical protein KDB46_14035, partial [Solirubrobacterales bacterium]|nr:hypothetical protein [Solirubrobacterales bacterium]
MAMGLEGAPKDPATSRARIYEYAPQMRVYHRALNAQYWQPFVMRGSLPNMNRPELRTDPWGWRH